MLKFSEEAQVIFQHIDPSTKNTLVGDSVIQATKCINISKFNRVTCIAWRMTGTGSIQDFALYAATTVAGAGVTKITASATGSTEATGLIATADGTNANGTFFPVKGAGMLIAETNAHDIDATLANADFVTARCSFATATDEIGLMWILDKPRYGQAGLSASGSG